MQIFSWHMLCLISYKRRWEEASWRGCESTSSSSTSEIKNPNSHAVSSTSRACHCLSASPTIILGQFAATAVSLRLSHEIILWPVNDRLITSSSRDAATERQSVNDNIVFSQAWNISQNSTNDSSSIILFPSVFRHETSLLSNLYTKIRFIRQSLLLGSSVLKPCRNLQVTSGTGDGPLDLLIADWG